MGKLTLRSALVSSCFVVACGQQSDPTAAALTQPVESSQRGAYYDVSFPPAPSLTAVAAAHPELDAKAVAERFVRELATQAAPYWASGSVTMPALTGVGGTVVTAPAPATSRIRYSCGVTLISPSYAVTAGHCPTADTKLDELKLQMYRATPALAESWTKSEPLSGSWPSLHHPKLESADGYVLDEYSCQLLSRCYSNNFNCQSSGSDVAVMKCDGRPGDKYGFLNVSLANETGHEAVVHWKHEVLDLGPAPIKQDYVDHYVSYADGSVNNFHYFESENQLLPLRSIAWPDGSLPQMLTSQSADLYGCHGTSGSGILARQGASNEYRLVGPVATGSSSFGDNLCQHVPNPGGVSAGPGLMGMSANLTQPQALLTQYQAELAQDCKARQVSQRDVAGLPFAPGSYHLSTLFSHLSCQPSAFAHDGKVAQDPSFGPYPETFVDDAQVDERAIVGFELEANADYRLAFQVQSLGACNGCSAPKLHVGATAEEAPVALVGNRSLLTRAFAAPSAGPLALGLRNGGSRLAFGGFTLIREGQVNSFDTLEDRLEAGLYALDQNGAALVGPAPMRFTGDGSAGFKALLMPGERVVLLRQALGAGQRWTARLGGASFDDLSCGLLSLSGELVAKQPCGAVVHLDDHKGAEPRLGFFVELPRASTRPSADLTYVALASDSARDPDEDGTPDVLDNCPGDWNAAQGDCSEEPPVIPVEGDGGAGGNDNAGGAAEGGSGSDVAGRSSGGTETGGGSGGGTETGGGSAGTSAGSNTAGTDSGSAGSSNGGSSNGGTSPSGGSEIAGAATTPPAAPHDDSGCSCRTPGSSPTNPSGAVYGLLALAVLSRRRTARGSDARSRPSRARAHRQ